MRQRDSRDAEREGDGSQRQEQRGITPGTKPNFACLPCHAGADAGITPAASQAGIETEQNKAAKHQNQCQHIGRHSVIG